jgi:hypothetical protein
MNHLFCFEEEEGHVVMKDDSIVPVPNRKKGLFNEIFKYVLR